MKKVFIIKKVLLILIFLMLILPKNIIYASVGSGLFGTVAKGWGYWQTKNSDTMMDTNISIGNTSAISATKNQTEVLLGIVQAIGSVLSVIALIIIGFRYMFSSLEERAQLKGVLPYYIVGCVLVFATSAMLGIVYDIFKELNS